MKLTPIKVRGKRGQPKTAKRPKRLSSPEREAPDGDDQVAPRTKHAKIRHDAAAADAEIDYRTRRKKAPPRLSQLPQEILERIFTVSMNLALPLVNRELHHRLSTNSVRYQLVGAAFGPTWDAWYGLDNSEVQSYDGWMSDADRIAGDATFQSAILACSWAKLPMMLESFNVWIRQHANGRPYFSFPPRQSNNDDPEDLDEEKFIFNDMKSKFHYDTGFFSTITGELLSGRSLISSDFEDMAFDCRAVLGKHLEVNPGAMIPDDLLAGPFFSDGSEHDVDDGGLSMDGEKHERLLWLVRGGACLQEEQTWEVSREGFRAILELIKEAAKRGEGLERDSGSATCSTQGMLKLAAGLFVLFDVLGVFSAQWPKYILQTSLAEITSLKPTLPQNSAAKALLGNIAAAFRNTLGSNGTAQIYELAGCRWRRPVMMATRRIIRRTTPSLSPRFMMQRERVFYHLASHRAAYLDAALAINLTPRGGPGGEATTDTTTTSTEDVTRTNVYQEEYIRWATGVTTDLSLVPLPFENPLRHGIGQDEFTEMIESIAHEPWSDFAADWDDDEW